MDYSSLVLKMFYLCIRITQFYDILSFSIFISILYETLYETICAVFRQIKRLFRTGNIGDDADVKFGGKIRLQASLTHFFPNFSPF